MQIKHLVLGGGGAGGLVIYGALRYLAKQNFWELNQIKTIYSTSIGSLIAVLIIICNDWATLDDYITKRPWDKVITVKPIDIINLWYHKGILNIDTIKNILEPLLKAKGLSLDITLKELYDISNIELHMYTTNLNAKHPEKIDISYKTHGDLDISTAVAMSAAFPIIFAPICDGSYCYIDGGLLNNFPLDDCIVNNPILEEILAIKITSKPIDPTIDNTSTLVNYLHNLLHGMYRQISSENRQQSIDNFVDCIVDINDFARWADALNDSTIRQELIDIGDKYGKQFLENRGDLCEEVDISASLIANHII